MSAALVIHNHSALANSDEWQTPDPVYDLASRVWGPFTIDVAAARWNHRTPKYFTKRNNGLKQRWRGRVWCNPPYSRGNLFQWLGKARRSVEARHAELVCCLVPSYTSERWWHRYVLGGCEGASFGLASWGAGPGFRYYLADVVVEVIFLPGRLRFRHKTGPQDAARHPSALVVFSRPVQAPRLLEG